MNFFTVADLKRLYNRHLDHIYSHTLEEVDSRGHGIASENNPRSGALVQLELHGSPERDLHEGGNLLSCVTIEYGKLHSKRLSYLVVSCFMISAKLSLSASVRSVILDKKSLNKPKCWNLTHLSICLLLGKIMVSYGQVAQ